MKLYSYWRSSAAWRVRIALAIKSVRHQIIPVSLIADGGHQHSTDYVALNPQRLVPTLVLDDGTALTQSLAIMDWLDAEYPQPPFLPSDTIERARVLAAAYLVAMDIHPINNLRVLNALVDQFGADGEAKKKWMQHWMREGFDALTAMLPAGKFAFGEQPTLADICIVPQFYNARRWGMNLGAWPRLMELEVACLTLAAFSETAPERQVDAV